MEGQPRTPTIFVTDASAEALRVVDVLRNAGYTALDVPLSMLISRASVQRPNAVVLDVDAEGALDRVAKLRSLPGSGSIDLVYVGSGAGPVKDAEDALSRGGSAFFERPIDVGGLVRRMEALTGGPASAARPEIRPSTPPPSIAPSRASSIPAAASSTPGLPALGARMPGPPLPLSTPSLVDLEEPPRSLASFGAVSSELAQLLATAEMRAEIGSGPDAPLPTPEEEIEAVLPADVLASLDEPLDADDDEENAQEGARTGAGAFEREGTGAHAKGTTSGGSRPPTTGAGRTPHETQERFGRAGETPRIEPRGPFEDVSISMAPSQTPSFLPTVTPPPEPRARALAQERREAGAAGVVLVHPSDARRFLADMIARRSTGSACFQSGGVARRVVLREGDFVTAASDEPGESLVHFLGARGELPRDQVERLAAKVPGFGRHAGAALVAHGFLRQDQLWSVLRAHAEWIATTILRLPSGTAQYEPDPPGRLRSEPSVFGAVTGCEIFVELVRRTVSPDEALAELGGETSRIGDGAEQVLLSECTLPAQELDLLSRARGGTIRDLLARAPDAEIVSVLHALALLGIAEVVPSPEPPIVTAEPAADEDAALDEEAIRARVRARLELVDEGDYFAVLGVARDSTGYEIRRAFLELRRAFEPSRILTPRLADLAGDVRKIVTVLEEAYEILRDNARRERYRRAIEARPE